MVSYGIAFIVLLLYAEWAMGAPLRLLPLPVPESRYKFLIMILI